MAAVITWALALLSGGSSIRLERGLEMETGLRSLALNCRLIIFCSVCNHSGTEELLGLLQPEQPGQRLDRPAAEAGTGVSGIGRGCHEGMRQPYCGMILQLCG